MRNHARELSIMSRGSHLGFSRDALKRASKVHQSSIPSPPAAGNSGTRSHSRRDRANMERSSSHPPGYGPVPALLRLQASFVFVAL
jgi:hypothetical protein